MQIGDKVLVRGTIDEIRKDVVIIKNEGGYFGTVPSEIVTSKPIEPIDKIRAEIEKQEKWLLQAGYNAYNVDIAFSSIKSVLAESEE